MKRFALALFFAVLTCCAAQAQNNVRVQAQAVATCGGQTLTAGVFYPVTQDLTGTLCTGSGGGGGGTAVTIADGADVTQGAKADATCGTATGTCSEIALLKYLNAAVTDTTPVNVTVAATTNTTPTDCSGTITTGGAAQAAFAANSARHGFIIANIDTTEPLWFSMTTTAAASGTGSYPLAAADATTFANMVSFTSPIGINTALSVIGATTAHKFTCTVW